MVKRNQADQGAQKSRKSVEQKKQPTAQRPPAASASEEARSTPMEEPSPARPAPAARKTAARKPSTPKAATPKPAVTEETASTRKASTRKTGLAKAAAQTNPEDAKPEKKAPARPRSAKKAAPASEAAAAKPARTTTRATRTTARTSGAAKAAASATTPDQGGAEPFLTPPSREAAPPSPAAEVQPAYVRPAPLGAPHPETGGGSRVVLMIRDPEWLYAYWEISEADRAAHAIGQPQGAPPLLLRVFDQGVGAAPAPTGDYFDVTVIPDANGWYIRIPAGGGNWSAALGYLNYEGHFVALAQSNIVTTPGTLALAWNEQSWGPVSAEMEAAETAGIGTEEEVGIPGGPSRLVQRASRLMAHLRGMGTGEQLPRLGSSEQFPRPGASEQVIPRPGASEQVPYFGAIEQIPLFGASEQVPRLGASEQFPRPGASEQVLRLGGSEQAMAGGVGVLEKTFWLQVHTELIVYGATEPDARVTVQGVPIQLRPDGTFTLRFALPDGEQVIPVHAVNADDDMERTITPIVRKRTV